jgi:putative IMPACT (imprinted ancient) family translation regulator
MPVFAVLARANQPELAQQMEKHYKEDHLKYNDDVWFLKTKGTPQQICKRLRQGIEDEKEPPDGLRGVVVMRVTSSYYGLSAAEVWDWLEAAFAPAPDA